MEKRVAAVYYKLEVNGPNTLSKILGAAKNSHHVLIRSFSSYQKLDSVGVNLPLSSVAGITEFKIRKRCKDLLTSFRITINVKPL